MIIRNMNDEDVKAFEEVFGKQKESNPSLDLIKFQQRARDLAGQINELEQLQTAYNKTGKNEEAITDQQIIKDIKGELKQLTAKVDIILNHFDRIFGDHVLIERYWTRVKGIARDEETIQIGHNFRREHSD